MKKLSKAKADEWNKLIEDLEVARSAVMEEHSSVCEAVGEVNARIADYNEILEKLTGFKDEIVSEMDTFYEEKSEKWQEGDAGSAYMEWKMQWEGLDLEEAPEMDEPDEPSLEHVEELQEVPQELE